MFYEKFKNVRFKVFDGTDYEVSFTWSNDCSRF